MKRKWLSLMLALAMVTSLLSGCGGGNSESGGTGEQSPDAAPSSTVQNTIFNGELEQNITIRVLENDTVIAKGYFAELIDAFNEAYADYGIVAVDANMDQYLDLANDGPYGYGPDVLYQANDIIMQYAEGKHVYPLPIEQLECYDQIPQSAWDAYAATIEGTEYYCGVPVNIQAPMLYYRKDLLPENWESEWDQDGDGVPDMTQRWSDLLAFSQARHEGDKNLYGYMKSLDDVYFSSGFLFSYGTYIFGNNNRDTEDIGFAAGEAEKGAWVLSQLASAMNEDCIDSTITTNAYSRMADGTYFATITTPDVYSTFIDELTKTYMGEGLDQAAAEEKAVENLVMTGLPKLPESGDLSDESAGLIDSKAMGGINGYAISAYTQYPNACLAFVEFATGYDMIMKRSEMLGIAPARADAAQAAGETSQQLFDRLEQGNIIIMPSVKAVGQIWTPGQTFFIDLAKDVFRPESEKKYTDLSAMKQGLEEMSQQIYDAIHTLN